MGLAGVGKSSELHGQQPLWARGLPQGHSSKVPSVSTTHWDPDPRICGAEEAEWPPVGVGSPSEGRWPRTAGPAGEGPLELGKAARQNVVRREADSSSEWSRVLALLRSSQTPSPPGTWGKGDMGGRHRCRTTTAEFLQAWGSPVRPSSTPSPLTSA